MKNLLLIGDSIRMGYDKSVKKTLEGKANVIFPDENCRFASYVLRYFHEYLKFFEGEKVDVIQVGARNMQNFELLKELGRTNKPILLKRGLANTLKELLMSAEYIMSEGNEQVILCERGIRSYDSYTRNVLDLAAVPVLKGLTHLPIVVDPSHATGRSSLVPSMAVAAAAAVWLY